MNFVLMDLNNLPLSIHILICLSTVIFAWSGVLVVRRSSMDAFGALVAGCLTAIGGGSIRDMLLGTPAFWIADPLLLYLAVLASLAAFLYMRYSKTFPPLADRTVLVLDAVGLSLFTAIGVEKAELLGAPAVVCVLMGVVTGVGGGILRDICAGRMPLVMRREIYATASIAGGAMMMIVPGYIGLTLGILLCLLVRLLALYLKLSLPKIMTRK